MRRIFMIRGPKRQLALMTIAHFGVCLFEMRVNAINRFSVMLWRCLNVRWKVMSFTMPSNCSIILQSHCHDITTRYIKCSSMCPVIALYLMLSVEKLVPFAEILRYDTARGSTQNLPDAKAVSLSAEPDGRVLGILMHSLCAKPLA